MRRQPRRAFAAPFVIAIAAAAPACSHGSGAGTDTTVHRNPPAPDPLGPTGTPTSVWTVWGDGDQCSASYDVDCPEDMSCNPPPPMAVACPGGMAEGASMRIVQLEEGGPCYSEAMDCPEEGGCDRQPAECPHYDEEMTGE